MSNRPRVALVLLALFLLPACRALRQQGPPAPRERTILAVENQGFPDMAIYAVDGGRRVRIGVAPGHTTTELTIPASLAASSGPIRFLADPIGSDRTSVSNEVNVYPGRRMLLVIPPR